jgi:hypothetical protein
MSEIVRACSDSSGARQEALLRASIPIFYAHWEGYFVFAANLYLNFLAEKRVRLSDLKNSIWALAIRKKFNSNQVGSDKNFHRFLVQIRDLPDATLRRGNLEKINANSNLRSDVLLFCCECLAIRGAAYQDYLEFIDKDLVDRRNFIAHGESLRISSDKVPDIRDKVMEILRITKNEIENTVVNKGYLR